MDRDQIAQAFALIMHGFTGDRPSQEEVDAAGAAALNVAAQVVIDLHRIADAQERIAAALEKTAPAPTQDRP